MRMITWSMRWLLCHKTKQFRMERLGLAFMWTPSSSVSMSLSLSSSSSNTDIIWSPSTCTSSISWQTWPSGSSRSSWETLSPVFKEDQGMKIEEETDETPTTNNSSRAKESRKTDLIRRDEANPHVLYRNPDHKQTPPPAPCHPVPRISLNKSARRISLPSTFSTSTFSSLKIPVKKMNPYHPLVKSVRR